ncbi:hypothetical protein CQ14_30930 [Bradyrhizobium lablabi]|uniref:Uncharacterized protein n=1 Tax=Bradyrhizobium lablabi TaxID=722472 RepID=A0A0R3MXY8_9BRAD|nr:hypothetical protein [Bradyrhizobium lablabi]KRR22624.1 hypothetical protein CQ14_30930 [Bradyrhizobium lablabi]
MESNVVKFPYSVSRRVHSRKPRRSKNGTPEERAAKAAAEVHATAAAVIEISPRVKTGVGHRHAPASFRDFVEKLSQITPEEFPDFIAGLRKLAGLP